MSSGVEDEIIRRLEEQEREQGALSPLLDFYKGLAVIQSEAVKQMGMPRLRMTDETVKRRLEDGLPLLTFDKLDLDWSVVSEVFAKVSALFAERSELFSGTGERLEECEADWFTPEMAKAWFEGSALPASAEDMPLIEGLISATLSPFITRHARELHGRIDQERWRRRYCPVCGGKPDFAFLDKERGARWLFCSRCNGEWLFQRLECPCCGCTDQNSLSYFADDVGRYRLYVCEACKRYMKAIDLRQSESGVILPLERLLTLGLDVQAREYGYVPCMGEVG